VRDAEGPWLWDDREVGRWMPEEAGLKVDELVRLWDGVVADFLDGSTSVPPVVRPWYRSYRGDGLGQVVDEALPSPTLDP
jgi:hypothetical protein